MARRRRQLSTRDYAEDSRARLGEAIERARIGAGFATREAFAAEAGISPRNLIYLEQADRPVGQKTLFAVAAALPGWDNETPRQILEGDPAPPVTQKPRPVTLTDEQKLLVRAYWVYRNKLGSHEAAMIQLADDVNTINRVREMIENATKAAGE